MSDLSAFLNEQMNNPEFAQEYNAVQPEMDAIRSMIKARKSQNLTQKQLAESSALIRVISVNWKMGCGTLPFNC